MFHRSVEPVFHAQAGDFLEIHEVAGAQRCVMGHADGGDFQVHRADANARVAEAVKGVRRRGIEEQDREFDERLDAAVQPAIGGSSGRDFCPALRANGESGCVEPCEVTGNRAVYRHGCHT